MKVSSSTWSDMIKVYADAKKYDVLRRVQCNSCGNQKYRDADMFDR